MIPSGNDAITIKWILIRLIAVIIATFCWFKEDTTIRSFIKMFFTYFIPVLFIKEINSVLELQQQLVNFKATYSLRYNITDTQFLKQNLPVSDTKYFLNFTFMKLLQITRRKIFKSHRLFASKEKSSKYQKLVVQITWAFACKQCNINFNHIPQYLFTVQCKV